MKPASIKYAVAKFREIKAELGQLEDLGGSKIVCLVRQHHQDTDRGWLCQEIGLEMYENDYVFWAVVKESRVSARPDEMRAAEESTIRLVLDPESIDSIEFETFDEDA